jgi:hypothetical protein
MPSFQIGNTGKTTVALPLAEGHPLLGSRFMGCAEENAGLSAKDTRNLGITCLVSIPSPAMIFQKP